MVASLTAALALTVIYRVTVNLPDLPYSEPLKRVGSSEFLATSRDISLDFDMLLSKLQGQHKTSVVKYRYHQVIGTLAYLDIYSDAEREDVHHTLLRAVHDGFVGKTAVSTEGFELHVTKESNDRCPPAEFQCSDGSCISAHLRCNHHRDCPDGSDESRKHAQCSHHIPVIYQTDKIFSVPNGGVITLSAVIDEVPDKHQVLWSRGDEIIGENTLATVTDKRISAYKSENQYFLRINNAKERDAGEYTIAIAGLNVTSTFEVRITADSVPTASTGCPSGERACRSGHCLPVSQFCDRTLHCPDGDDEKDCSVVECSSTELRCESSNVCVPLSVKCDGWKDCHDGTDEQNCTSHSPVHVPVHHHKKKHHSRLTVTCEDGTEPEYSLHGSMYCWSNSVCPTGTSCEQGLCCASGRNEKRSVDSECAAGEFRCENGQCITEDKKCNRHYDCTDGTDETTCDYFIAVRKHHEAQKNTHEAQPQATENTQEANHTEEQKHRQHHESHHQNSHHAPNQDPNHECNDQQFRCPYLVETKCFHYEKLCDGVDDCGDGSDESNCESASQEDGEPAEEQTEPQQEQRREHHEQTETAEGHCSHEQFRCGSGKCIEKSLECNHKYDCDDGTDETHCEYFKEAMARRNNEGEREKEDERRRQHEETQRQQHEELTREEEKRRHEEAQRHQHEEKQREEERRRVEGQSERAREEEKRRDADREAELRRREEEVKRREEEDSRREAELRRREEEERRKEDEQHRLPSPGISQEVIFREEYDDDVACLEHEFQCHTGECIDKRRVCDTRPDCLDSSDEANCFEKQRPAESRGEEVSAPPVAHHERHSAQPARTEPPQLPQPRHQDIDSDGANEVQITIYPTESQVRDGRDVTFDCRARTADNSVYPPVRWTRVGGPLPAAAHDAGGRLTLSRVSLADAGRYVCVATHNGQTVEAHATLNVQSYGPQELQGLMSSGSGQCMADEKSCGNNECVKSEYVCDGERDCRDGSDEHNCPAMRTCEPNEFKCSNTRCVQKMWLCDGDDDCGDNSDEQNCGAAQPGDRCKKTEFQCHDQQQCVPSSFHCDGTNDCRDGSDEVGCVQPTVVDPPETNKQVPVGSTFKLTCRAVSVPEPYINWRLNWGPVCEPPRCLQTSEGGFGTLTVNNAQPLDQGAYTCEAINVKGRVLATPDCIVRIVNAPIPQPPVPRPEPQREPSCNVAGSQSPYPDHTGRCPCKPMVTGPNCDQCRPGSFHLSDKSPQGCINCFCFGITDQCRSSSYYRTKDRLMFAGESEGVVLSDMEERSVENNPQFQYHKTGYLTFSQPINGAKYWKLPQRFLGNKVTAYGGKMEFEVEFSGNGQLSREPMVVLKGNQNILVHRIRNQENVLRSDSPVKITVETYENSYEQLNGSPATRADLMLVLADLDGFLIRASHISDQYSTSLGDVSWEIAVDRYTPDGLALEVEQCSCPPGYIGTSCEDCAPGYERSGHGPYLGTCVPIQRREPVCTGPGIASPHQQGGRCQCKSSATGPNCDQCSPNSFYMAATNPQGCIPCFCSGVTQQCQSSTYTRSNVDIDYQRGDRDQLQLASSDVRRPFSPQTPAYVSGAAIEFSSFHESQGQTLYWKLPAKFLGNKVTAYGGHLKYTFRYSGEGRNNQDADVIIRGNDITLQYTHREPIYPDRDNMVTLKISEEKWQRVDGQQATREHLLMALAGLDSVLIKATYIDDCSQSSLTSVSLEFAEPRGTTGKPALEVEQCQCPSGYIGTSCEECAPGYSRTGGGLYLGLCEKCECNGHAGQCDKEYGFCVDCQHNTEGDQCERCKPGFVGDARRGTPHDCQPAATRPPCQCNNHSPRGCDSFGRCLFCEHNTEGVHCERCKKGFYGDAKKGTPFDCTPCPCPGASDCFLDSQGQVACRNCPAGLSGRLCNECAPGYTRSNKEAGRICEPIGSVTNQERTYVPSPPEGTRPPQPVIDPPYQKVNENDPASFRCYVPGIPDCQITFHKERVGGALGHGVYQTGNVLKIPRAQLHDAGNYICTAHNQYGIGTSIPAKLDVVRPAQRPKVDPIEQTVDEGEPARFRCWVPGNPEVELKWYRIGKQPLPHGVQEQQGILHISRASQTEAGQYICVATDPRDRTPQDSEPVTLNVQKPSQPPSAPQVDPPEQTVNENDPAQYRCWVPGNPNAQLKWARQDGQPLPQGTLERDGYLRINNAKMSDAGNYICTATDPRTGNPQQAPPARLNVKQPAALTPQVDPPEQTVDEGSPARIRCWVPGNPNAQLKWSKQGRQPLPQGSQEQGGLLTIARTMKADEGEYICTAFDPNTRQQAEAPPARVNVKQPVGPIKPIIEPNEQTVPEGHPFRLRCHVPGHPHIEVSFRKESGDLPESSDERRGLLSVSRAEMIDAGEYICSADDPNTGDAVDSDPATVHVTPRQAPALTEKEPDHGPEVSPPQQTVPEGDPATLKCWVPGNPHAQLAWKRADGGPMPFGASEDGGTLSIPSTQKADQGDFICTYHPPSGAAPKDSKPSKLNVHSPGAPPRPVATPPVITVKRGEPAKFDCIAHSDTPARISWGYLDSDSPLPVDVSRDGDSILIHKADDAQAGEYVCSATNDFGTGVAEPVKLIVTDDEEPPTARVVPRTWNGKPGDRHQFTCIVTGVPTPEVTWTGPGNTPLPHDVTALEGNILDFANGRSELNGDYTCTAKNPIGEASDHGAVNIGPSLTVKTTPAGPKLILTVGEPLMVKCEAFGDPDPEVEWLHDPGPIRGDLPDDYKPVTISEQFIRHPAIGLGNAGLYTCKGSNSHATATKDIYIEVVEPSRVATVSILGGSSQWFEQGEPSELICTATGSSLVDRLEWIKVDDQLPTDVEEHNEPGLLHFPNFKNSYAGEYECRGFRQDQLIATASVTVHASTDDTDDVKVEIEPPRVRVVSQGESIVLKCSVEGATKGENYEWALLRGGNLVRKLGNEAQLTIQKADPSNDFGVYRCNIEDDNGVVIGSAYSAVTVGYEDKNNAVMAKFDDKSDASFICPVYSVPGSKVEWTRQDGELPNNAVPNGNKLEIKQFDESASGMYVCKVTFENNEVEGYVHAQVFVPDTIIQVLLDVSSESVSKGDRAWFDCKVTGDPTSQITWTKEGADSLPENSQVTGGRLLFTDVTEENAGTYRCRAKTKAGPLETRTVLNIGSAKRKRHHHRRGRQLRAHRRRHATAPRQVSAVVAVEPKHEQHHSMFGSWFSTN